MTGLELVRSGGNRNACQFSPDDRRLAYFMYDGGGGVWEVAASQTFRRLPVSASVTQQRTGVQIHPGGRLLACTSAKGVHFWDLSGHREVECLKLGAFFSANFSPDGESLITSGAKGVHLWPLTFAQGGLTVTVGPPEPLVSSDLGGFRASDLTPDGGFLAAVTLGHKVVWCNTLTREARVAPFEHPGCEYVSISSDGRWIASGPRTRGSGLNIWDTHADESVVRNLWPGEERIQPLFDPTGQWLLATTDKECRIYEARTWKMIRQIEASDFVAQKASVLTIAAISPDGNLLALRTAIGHGPPDRNVFVA